MSPFEASYKQANSFCYMAVLWLFGLAPCHKLKFPWLPKSQRMMMMDWTPQALTSRGTNCGYIDFLTVNNWRTCSRHASDNLQLPVLVYAPGTLKWKRCVLSSSLSPGMCINHFTTVVARDFDELFNWSKRIVKMSPLALSHTPEPVVRRIIHSVVRSFDKSWLELLLTITEGCKSVSSLFSFTEVGNPIDLAWTIRTVPWYLINGHACWVVYLD